MKIEYMPQNKAQWIVIYPENSRSLFFYLFICGLFYYAKKRDSSIGIPTSYGLGGRGFGVQFPADLHSVQADSEFHPASYLMDT
jgi:hypothetical protein